MSDPNLPFCLICKRPIRRGPIDLGVKGVRHSNCDVARLEDWLADSQKEVNDLRAALAASQEREARYKLALEQILSIDDWYALSLSRPNKLWVDIMNIARAALAEPKEQQP